MSAKIPQQPFLKAGGYDKEPDTFSDFQLLLRNFSTKKLRYSRTSPPIVADVGEGEFVLDKTLGRIYITVDGVLKYITLT